MQPPISAIGPRVFPNVGTLASGRLPLQSCPRRHPSTVYPFFFSAWYANLETSFNSRARSNVISSTVREPIFPRSALISYQSPSALLNAGIFVLRIVKLADPSIDNNTDKLFFACKIGPLSPLRMEAIVGPD